MKQALKFVFTILTLAAFNGLSGQSYAEDILRFSTNNSSATVRNSSLGGANVASGGDFATLSSNPGGMGMFRSSFGTFNANVYSSRSTTLYFDQASEKARNGLTIGSLGFVFVNPQSKNGLFQSSAFGIGFNQQANFNRFSKVEGTNPNRNNSITQTWVNEVNAINQGFDGPVDVDQFSFEAVNAYQTFLVNYDTALNTYTTPITEGIQQTRFLEERGTKSEIVFSGGANYLDKLYFGATVGLPIVSYTSNTRFIENDEGDINGDFREFELNQDYETEGLGFNFRAGIIYKPVQFLRIGLSAQSPERIFLNERYSSEISSSFNAASYFFSSPQGEFEYSVRLPWRVRSGLAFVWKKNGLFSVDYEVVNHGSARYIFETDFEERAEEINETVMANYGYAHNLSAGIEGVVKKLRLRAGYNYTDSPLKSGNNSLAIHRVSGGLGYIWERVALDLGASYSFNSSEAILYDLDNVSPVYTQDNNLLNVMLGISYRFR